jgi:hypothetical protein
MSNVVALGNFSVPDSGPVAPVVEILEEMLAKAREGKIIGVAVVAAERDPLAFETVFHGGQMSRHTLAAGVLSLHYQFGRNMTEIENE